jgi:mRNA interferase MazF
VKRGEIYWADLIPRSGSEQKGKRPVVVISHDGFNSISQWRSIIVIPLSTSQRQAGRGPTAIAVSKGTAGIPQSSVVLCHQITTLDRAKLTQRIGMLPPSVMSEIEEGLKAALSLE